MGVMPTYGMTYVASWADYFAPGVHLFKIGRCWRYSRIMELSDRGWRIELFAENTDASWEYEALKMARQYFDQAFEFGFLAYKVLPYGKGWTECFVVEDNDLKFFQKVVFMGFSNGNEQGYNTAPTDYQRARLEQSRVPERAGSGEADRARVVDSRRPVRPVGAGAGVDRGETVSGGASNGNGGRAHSDVAGVRVSDDLPGGRQGMDSTGASVAGGYADGTTVGVPATATADAAGGQGQAVQLHEPPQPAVEHVEPIGSDAGTVSRACDIPTRAVRAAGGAGGVSTATGGHPGRVPTPGGRSGGLHAGVGVPGKRGSVTTGTKHGKPPVRGLSRFVATNHDMSWLWGAGARVHVRGRACGGTCGCARERTRGRAGEGSGSGRVRGRAGSGSVGARTRWEHHGRAETASIVGCAAAGMLGTSERERRAVWGVWDGSPVSRAVDGQAQVHARVGGVGGSYRASSGGGVRGRLQRISASPGRRTHPAGQTCHVGRRSHVLGGGGRVAVRG